MNNMNRPITKEDMIEIMRGISKKIPTSGGIVLWQPETDYVENQIILYNATLYRVIENFTSGLTFKDTKLEMIGGGSLKEWEANTEYSENNILVYEGQIYIALVKFISGNTFDKVDILEEYTLSGGETPILWAKGEEINTNDIVEYNNEYYKALVDFTCGEEFTKVALKEYVPQPLTEEQIEEAIEAYEPEFDGISVVDDILKYIYNFRKSNTAYSVGDIAYSHNLPSYLRLECVKAGTTGATEPDFSQISGGGIVTDGSILWIVDDIRDGTPVGQVRASMFVPSGYVKLEGGTVSRENYPRLVALADAYSLWTSDTANNPGLFGEGDGATTMVLPNWTGRMAQFAATAGGAVEAGLPNITGSIQVKSTNTGGRLGIASTGAFEATSDGQVATTAITSSFADKYTARFDASRSSSIYGNSTTVQPPAINVFAIMRY